MRLAIFRTDGRPQGRRTLALLAILLPACAVPAPEPAALRLTDLYPRATVEGAVDPTLEGTFDPPTSPPYDKGGRPRPSQGPAIEWRFQGEAARSDSPSGTWESFHGVADLTLRKGLLVGTTTGYPPLLHLQRMPDPQDLDLVDAVEVRMKASRGGWLALGFAAGGELDRERLLGFAANAPLRFWPANAALLPGERMRTYVLRPQETFRAPESRHLFLLPTDLPEAEFAIESVHLVLHRERLAGTPSGVGWHGLGGIYRETVVARVPETVRYRLRLPSRPRLEVALGTLVPDPVTFRVTVTGDRSGGEPVVVLEDTVTTPGRWESLPVDLAAFGGEPVELALQLAADHPGLVGLWGSPVVRDLGAGAQGVILILADALRADHLDAYGYERRTAPVLGRIAASGARFATCFAAAPSCKPSIASILTSLDPLTHGVVHSSDRLPPAAVTLAEVFRQAGFATLSFSSLRSSGRHSGAEQGFEVVHEDASLSDLATTRTAREYVDRLLPWLEAHREVPFFVLLHLLDAQYPFASRAEPEQAGVSPSADPAAEVARYDEAIRGLDAELGRILEQLRQLGLEESTLIAVVGDHGAALLDDGMPDGHGVYGAETRVPLILRGPGVEAGVVAEQMVRTIDLMPTLLELCGLAPPEGIRGQSLVPLLRAGGGRPWQEQPAFIARVGAEPPDTGSFALVIGGWKLVEITAHDPPRYELYHLETDPLDLRDLSARNPDVVERLRDELERWRERTAGQRLPAAEEAGEERLTAEESERLGNVRFIGQRKG